MKTQTARVALAWCALAWLALFSSSAVAKDTASYSDSRDPQGAWIREIGQRWMAGVPDRTSLAALSLPGTHDSAADVGFGNANVSLCQTWSLAEQLACGVRFLDIRCRHKGNAFHLHHGSTDLKKEFARDVRDVCMAFLNANPRECIVMRIKREHEDEANTQTFCRTLQGYMRTGRWLASSRVPTLGQARGKIVVVSADEDDFLDTDRDRVIVYEDKDFKKRSEELGGFAVRNATEEIPDLDELDWGDNIDSIRIPKGLRVTAWGDDRYTGTQYGPFDGPVSLREVPGRNDWDSMRIEPTPGTRPPRSSPLIGRYVFPARQVQDDYDINGGHTISDKVKDITTHFRRARDDRGRRWHLNFTSASVSSVAAVAMPPKSIAQKVNPNVLAYVRHNDHVLGTVAMDFPGEALIAHIIYMNPGAPAPHWRDRVGIFEDRAYGKRAEWLRVGSYPDLDKGFPHKWRNDIDSIKIPAGFQVTAWEDRNFKKKQYGPFIGPLQIPEVDGRNDWDSMKIERHRGSVGPRVTIYEDRDFKKQSATLGVGNYPDLDKGLSRKWRNDVDSIKIPAGLVVTAWEDRDYKKKRYGPFVGPLDLREVPGRNDWDSMKITRQP